MLKTKIFKVEEEAELNEFITKVFPRGINFRENYVAVLFDDGSANTAVEIADNLRVKISGAEDELLENEFMYLSSMRNIEAASKHYGEGKVPEQIMSMHEMTKTKFDQSKDRIAFLKKRLSSYGN